MGELNAEMGDLKVEMRELKAEKRELKAEMGELKAEKRLLDTSGGARGAFGRGGGRGWGGPKALTMVPASRSMVCDCGVHQTSVAAARSTCSVANVSEGCPWATVIERVVVSKGTRSISERKAPPCVKAFWA